MPVPKEIIDRQLSSIRQFDEFFTRKEISYLPEIIREGETIQAVISGMYDGNTWLIVATDQRLLFLDKGLLYGLKQIEMPLSEIQTIQHKTGIVFGELLITTAGGAKKIEKLWKKGTERFAALLSEQIHVTRSSSYRQQDRQPHVPPTLGARDQDAAPSTPGQTRTTPDQRKSTLSQRIVLLLFLSLLWVVLSGVFPLFGIIGSLLLGAFVVGLLASGGMRATIWSVFRKTQPKRAPWGYGVPIVLVACLGLIVGIGSVVRKAEDREMRAEDAKREAEEKKQQEERRKTRFEHALAQARNLAGDEANADKAIESFSAASRLGKLPAKDATTYANLLKSRGERLAAKGDDKLGQAVADFENAKALLPGLEGIDASVESARSKLERRQRADEVEQWVARAEAVASDAGLCDTPKEIADAWTNLKNVTPKDGVWKRARRAAAKLERCRKKTLAALVSGGLKLMKEQREEWARKYEIALLDNRIDARVTLRGPWKDMAVITYALFNRAWAHNITDGGSMQEGSFLATLQKMGFKRVTFSDGYDSSFFYKLDPEDERKAFSKVLDNMGLGKPLRF